MIIKETKYVICSKYYPIEFESDFSGVMTENFKDSYLYSDTFGLPDKINAKDLKSVWIETIKNFGDEFVTSNKTIDKTIKLENFESIKNKGIELGTLLANNGHLDEATAVLQKNIGLDEDGNVKSFDCLRENQLDLTKIIVMDLEELVDKYKLK